MHQHYFDIRFGMVVMQILMTSRVFFKYHFLLYSFLLCGNNIEEKKYLQKIALLSFWSQQNFAKAQKLAGKTSLNFNESILFFEWYGSFMLRL